jgi:membrane fusion protein, copper/silver efflux system
MSETENRKDLANVGLSPSSPSQSGSSEVHPDIASSSVNMEPTDSRWWIKLFLPPLLLLAAGVVLIVLLGLTQRLGWIGRAGDGHMHTVTSDGSTTYICPMMCTPPQSEPGRCPVCAMELVPATNKQDSGDMLSVEFDPATRRIANIQTATVQSLSATRRIRAVGDLTYNETSLKNIAAYVEVRLEKLYADFTGLSVQTGDPLALVYSPQLYTAQVEYLLTQSSGANDRRGGLSSQQGRFDLQSNARQRLIEFGMTDEQIDRLQSEGRANSRLTLYAPNNGTIIEKLAVEGQYVSQGQPIYRLADLSSLWLILRLFPEDAAVIRYGQRVQSEIQSLPGKTFTGRVAFIDPSVDPNTRTVGVRVVVPNPHGLLKAGDLATASIEVPLHFDDPERPEIYDEELAGQFISPRHPFIVRSSPGICPECGLDLIPTGQLGYVEEPSERSRVMAVPRNSVLYAAGNGMVYVETEPGRFTIRPVVLGPSFGNQIAILDGLMEGELVAEGGNFLIDSQMQLTGRPSLIDPTRAEPSSPADLPQDSREREKIMTALAELSEPDRQAALQQEICPVARMPLGSMGTPPKVDVDGDIYFICCEGCRKRLLDDPQKYLANLKPLESERSPREVQ